MRYVDCVALVASVVAKGTWMYTPALHGELLNKFIEGQEQAEGRWGTRRCHCPIGGRQAPWPACQERESLPSVLPLQSQDEGQEPCCQRQVLMSSRQPLPPLDLLGQLCCDQAGERDARLPPPRSASPPASDDRG